MISKQERLKRLGEEIQRHGYRLTAARRTVLASLVESDGHVSADDLVHLAHQGHNRVGRMTVYRTLDLLLQLGLIRPVYQGTGAAHFVLMTEGHHHHLICSSCDRVIEFDSCSLRDVGALLSRNFNFEIRGHLLEVYGLCQDCQPRA